MKFSLRSSLRRLCILAGSSLLLAGITGCKVTRIDFYNPTPTSYEVQTLGDSYIDYENPNQSYEAYIPTFLNEHASRYHGKDVVYKDRSVSGAKLSHVLNTQFPAARSADAADAGYQIKTIIINGGENDLREACPASTTVDSSGNYVYNATCEAAVASVISGISGFFDNIHSQAYISANGTPPDIVWLGRYHLPGSVVHISVYSRVVNAIKSKCESVPRCFFVDTRPAWTPQTAYLYLQNNDVNGDNDKWATDGPIHVNELGGRVVADMLWAVLSNPANSLQF